MKKLLLLLFLLPCSISWAQTSQHAFTDQIDSFNWDIIGSVKFKTTKPNEMYPVYTEMITRFSGRPFELEGYMVPIKDGMKQTRFMLSTLPINQCFYCGKNGIPTMIMVEMTEPVKFTFETVTVKGTLKLDNRNAAVYPPISLVKANLTQ
ncbi:hypothetical protein KHS38_21905 [Mucilaginibacter sp. Bleaf8]|uniref:hypothetical protein n=1 Tax=Mucilaginibacter sp. Bleaf8 TaxID=2834430 RepID=UPI001BCDA164|nr:hypothetical protein [Mucilaginibacter sp. Bleaf8]MBS7567075.1 hypothetical protein [Mucilaginibacter sp. Bleaf8]